MKKWIVIAGLPVATLLTLITLVAYLATALIAGTVEPPKMVVSQLPLQVTKWRPVILREMEKQGLATDYIDLMLAQMMQESGGEVVDIFQCSESKYGVPGRIQSEEESIEQAVKYWLELLHRAEVLGVESTDENILQSYNMGIGYLDRLHALGQNTTPVIALGFSEDTLHHGGDPNYVANVLRYMEFLIPSENAHVIRTMKFSPSPGQLFGNRLTPIPGRDLSNHEGLDLAAPSGTPVYSAMQGVAINAYDPSLGGIQVNVMSGNVLTIYAHLSASNVATGQVVDQNTMIGFVGSTGASTGPHLHFGWYINGMAVDPVPYLSPEQFTEEFLRNYGY